MGDERGARSWGWKDVPKARCGPVIGHDARGVSTGKLLEGLLLSGLGEYLFFEGQRTFSVQHCRFRHARGSANSGSWRSRVLMCWFKLASKANDSLTYHLGAFKLDDDVIYKASWKYVGSSSRPFYSSRSNLGRNRQQSLAIRSLGAWRQKPPSNVSPSPKRFL